MKPFLPEKIDLLKIVETRQSLAKELEPLQTIDLIFIKGTIIIEFLLDKAMENLSRGNCKYFLSLSSFRQKLHYVESLGIFEVDKGKAVLESLILISETRNKFAHTLKFPENKLDELLNIHPDVTSEIKNKNEIVKAIFASVCGALLAQTEALIIVNNAIAEMIPNKQAFLKGTFQKWPSSIGR